MWGGGWNPMAAMMMMKGMKGDGGWGKGGGGGFGKGGGGGGFGKGGKGGGGEIQQPLFVPAGKEYIPGKYYEEPGGKCGIEGLKDAITRACEPHQASETTWKKDEMVNKICMSIFKTSGKWYHDDMRHKETGTAIQAQALLEEYTDKIMAGLSATCYEKPWFQEIYLSEAIALAAISNFKGGAMFKRTVAPIIVTHVDEAVFNYRQEERHQKVMWDSISSVGIKSDYLKKANKHLTTAYEAAHINAKYGTSPCTSPELGMVQDFVSAWISEFSKRAWDVLNNGINSPSPDQQIGVVTTLFQYLCDPAHSCLPHDLTKQLDTPPPAGWDFVQNEVITLFSQVQHAR